MTVPLCRYLWSWREEKHSEWIAIIKLKHSQYVHIYENLSLRMWGVVIAGRLRLFQILKQFNVQARLELAAFCV